MNRKDKTESINTLPISSFYKPLSCQRAQGKSPKRCYSSQLHSDQQSSSDQGLRSTQTNKNRCGKQRQTKTWMSIVFKLSLQCFPSSLFKSNLLLLFVVALLWPSALVRFHDAARKRSHRKQFDTNQKRARKERKKASISG